MDHQSAWHEKRVHTASAGSQYDTDLPRFISATLLRKRFEMLLLVTNDFFMSKQNNSFVNAFTHFFRHLDNLSKLGTLIHGHFRLMVFNICAAENLKFLL